MASRVIFSKCPEMQKSRNREIEKPTNTQFSYENEFDLYENKLAG